MYQRLVNTGSAVANNRERRSDAAAAEVEGGILRPVEVQPSVSVRRLASKFVAYFKGGLA